MRFVTFDEVVAQLRGRNVAIVGSAPSVLDNEPGVVDSHDIVVRVNNYKTGHATGPGYRTDVHYSFYGRSIRKASGELKRDGVRLCMCKCPDSKPISSEWHEKNNKLLGIDFRYVYEYRKDWWFCDTFIPDDARFLRSYNLLDQHIPSTGFAAILDVLDAQPARAYITGFDFFSSGIHNVDEKWRPGDPADPIGHSPERELAWIARHTMDYPFAFDKKLTDMVVALKQKELA